MNSLIRLAIGLAALAPVVSSVADDLNVDMVVNLTDAGRAIARPDAGHPTYYYAISKGYTEGGQILPDMPAPPNEWDVLHTMAKALYSQGYRTSTAVHQPALLLVFWWGYKAPEIIDNSGAASQKDGGFISEVTLTEEGGGNAVKAGNGGLQVDPINALMMTGEIPTHTVQNETEMEELVMGSRYEASTTLQNHPNLRLERLVNATRDPRYYVMVSALDFNQALNSKFVVYWTARASTPIYDHTLVEVIPTLVADIAPGFGRDTDGPQITDRPLAPDGRVIAGSPIIMTAQPASASQPASSP